MAMITMAMEVVMMGMEVVVKGMEVVVVVMVVVVVVASRASFQPLSLHLAYPGLSNQCGQCEEQDN